MLARESAWASVVREAMGLIAWALGVLSFASTVARNKGRALILRYLGPALTGELRSGFVHLDVVEFSDAELRRRGTIVELNGEEALIEVSDDQGVPLKFLVRPICDLKKITGTNSRE